MQRRITEGGSQRQKKIKVTTSRSYAAASIDGRYRREPTGAGGLCRRYEAGRSAVEGWQNNPDMYNFKRIAEFFKVTYEYLLGDTDSKVHENMALAAVLGYRRRY
jgi:hypothetical protein